MQLLNPWMLTLAIPAIGVLAYLIKKEFVKLPEDEEFQRVKAQWRKWIFVSRTLIIICLVIALAQPFSEVTEERKGDPHLTVLVDNSTSMEVMDTSFTSSFLDDLGERLPIKIRSVGDANATPLGEGIMNNLRGGGNLLLISDGNNNKGANLGDVSLFASQNNATINAINLKAEKGDTSVNILGPKKVVENVNNTFLIRVNTPGVKSYKLTVTIDGEKVLETRSQKNVERVMHKFTNAGYHEVVAKVQGDKNYFTNNDVFRKAVKVVDKPKILYLTQQDDGLSKILNELYDVDQRSSIPRNLSNYYSVVVNDMPASVLNRGYDRLNEFLIDGNGMVSFGGFNSYDRGKYKNSLFEQLLPVKVGNAKRKFGNNKVVLAIDRSKGGGKCRTIVNTVTDTKRRVCSDKSYTDVIKAQALEVLDELDKTNQVGAVAFDRKTYLIEKIQPLYKHENQLRKKIKQIQPGGNTLVSKGIKGGFNLLTDEQGSRYLILLTDGITYQGDRRESVDLAGSLHRNGIKLITVGIGRSVYDGFLKKAAQNGGGFYVPASDKGRLQVLFGDPGNKSKKNEFGLVVVNSGHFITEGTDPTAVMKGFNQVLPKDSAQRLITTDTGEPALTTWRYGLGKVASWTVFTGDSFGRLLNAKNSLLITRSVNWAIGDPERKKDYFVTVPNGRVGEPLTAEVKADKTPTAEGLQFVRNEDGIYEATFTPSKQGFKTLLDAKYAVNFPHEYQEVGMNEELPGIIRSTGGKVFKPSQVKQIVEHVRSVSTKMVTKKKTIVAPFLIAAIIIFLIEVLARRVSQSKHG